MIYIYTSRRMLKMIKMKYALLVGIALVAVGCSKFSMHRVDVVQGNYIEQTRLENLKPGMTKQEVQLLLGTPLVMDVYDPDIWYYVFFQSDSDGVVKKERKIKIHFDQNGRYQLLEGDVTPNVPVEDISVTEVI